MNTSDNLMKVSVITVTYNSENTLLETINSVFMQSYKNIEYIIIDGNSTDLTKQIINDNIFKIDKYISEDDSGIFNAMNKGFKYATGDIIGFLNSDDIFIDKNVISTIVAGFTEGIHGVYGDIQIVKRDNLVKVIRYWKSGIYPGSFRTGWMPPHPTFYIKSSKFKELNGFDESYFFQSDYDLMLRFFESYKFSVAYLDKVLVKMRYGGSSTISLRNILRGNFEAFQACRAAYGFSSFFTVFLKIIKKIPQFMK